MSASPAANEEKRAPDSLSSLLEHLVESTQGSDKVAIVDLFDSLDSRAHGPMLLFPAAIAISPIGMIPGMSVITGTLIILVATQMMFFSGRPWLPKRVKEFEFSRSRLSGGVEKMMPWITWIEKAVRHRLPILAEGLAIYAVAMICIVLAALFYPLAVVPFGVFVPALAVTILALGLTARDGLLIAIGYVLTAAAIVLLYMVWPF